MLNTSCRQCRADRRIRRIAQHAYSGGGRTKLIPRAPARVAALPVRGVHFRLRLHEHRFLRSLIIVNNNDVGRARYDSLQIKAETKSARHGLYVLLGYTWARTFDSGFSDGLAASPAPSTGRFPAWIKPTGASRQLNVNNTVHRRA